MLSLDSYNSEQCLPCDSRREKVKLFDHGCAVCLDEGPDTMLLPCSHAFHGECILQWVKNNFNCPMCRQQVGQFIPLNGSTIRDEFSDLWHKHYVEGTLNDEVHEPLDDDLKKEALREQIDMEEFEMLLDDAAAVVDDAAAVDGDIMQEESVPVVEEPSFSPRETLLDLIIPSTAYLSMMNVQLTYDLLRCNQNSPLPGPLVRLIGRRRRKKPAANLDEAECGDDSSPHIYTTFDNIRGGAGSGVLTTMVRMLVERQSISKLYPVLREVGPNVAIYFTTYEETKRILGRNSDGYADIGKQCFLSGCLGGFCGYLPRNRFNPFVPLQFGIHFSIFEMGKQMITNQTGRARLNVADVGSTAILGGIVGSCVTFPLTKLFNGEVLAFALERGGSLSLSKNLTSGFVSHVARMSPLWATTACGFEFSRRLITNT